MTARQNMHKNECIYFIGPVFVWAPLELCVWDSLEELTVNGWWMEELIVKSYILLSCDISFWKNMYAWYVQLIVVWTFKKPFRNVWDMSASSHRFTTCVEYCEAPGWQASTELWSSHNCCSWTMKLGNITHKFCRTWNLMDNF